MKRCGLLSKGVAKVMAVVMAVSMMFSADIPVNAAESTVIFKGGKTDEAYESNDASWLLNAADSDVITVKYTCTDDTHAGWGVLGWGATVDGNWKDGPGLSASETDATEKMSAKVTVKDLKKILGIKASSDVSFIKLGAWNGGKIESISISAKSSAPAATTDKAASTETKEEETKEVVIEAPPELSGDYLYLLDSTKTVTIWPDLYCQYWVPGQTIILTVEMESNGSFGGCLGTCVNKWAWAMESFSSDTGSTIEVKWMLTPIQNNIQLQFWWMSGSQIGIKSIKVDRATDPNPLSKLEQVAPSTPARDPYEGNANAAYSGYMDIADGGWWTQKNIPIESLISNVDPSTITSIVFNGETSFQLGYNGTTSGTWTQFDGITSYTATDIDLSENYYAAIGISKGDDVPYRFTWDVYTNGATPAGDGGSAEGDDSATEDANVATATYTFDMNEDGNYETFAFDVHDYISGLQVGDEVKVTAVLSSDGGWFGGGFGHNDANGDWTQQQIDVLGTTYTTIVPVLYADGNNVQVQQWWIGGADVTVDVTMEKVTQ